MKVLLSMLLPLFLVAAEYKSWTSAMDGRGGEMISTPGYFSRTHRLLVSKEGDCAVPRLRLVWDTFDPNVRDYLKEGNSVTFNVSVDDANRSVAFTFVRASDSAEGIRLYFDHGPADDALLQALKRGNDIVVGITGSRGLVGSFDLPYDYFSLSGFTAAYRQVARPCMSKGHRKRN